MLAAPHPRQDERLEALRRYGVLDTPREKEFDDIVALIADICEAPVAVVNLIDIDRQWFKAEVGLGVDSTPLATSLCSHVILERDFVEISDTLLDPRMCDNPLCTADGGFRFYAGAILKTKDDLPLGTLCVLDRKPRNLTELQRRALAVLADRVMSELNLRLALQQQNIMRREIDHRVKNSLASVGAIISLQASRAKHPEVRESLAAVETRIAAMEALHEELHQDSDDDEADLAALIRRAMDKLRHFVPDNLTMETAVSSRSLSSQEANAVALITNEFVTNSAKHGFPDSRRGTIRIESHSALDNGFRLLLTDDGAGTEDALERIQTGGGLGGRIIKTLAASIGGQARWTLANPGLQLELLVPARL